jgi:hypothetical protein
MLLLVLEPPLACSYNPGGSEEGIKESLPLMVFWIKYIAMAKSVESRAPRS